jgi:hypothetical protein
MKINDRVDPMLFRLPKLYDVPGLASGSMMRFPGASR